MAPTNNRVRALAGDYRAGELLAAAAARSAAELLARREAISADDLHEAVSQYRRLLLDARWASCLRAAYYASDLLNYPYWGWLGRGALRRTVPEISRGIVGMRAA